MPKARFFKTVLFCLLIFCCSTVVFYKRFLSSQQIGSALVRYITSTSSAICQRTGCNSTVVSVCNLVVEDNESGLECDGVCTKWFHISSVNVTQEVNDKIVYLNDDVLWMCPPYCKTDLAGSKLSKMQTSNDNLYWCFEYIKILTDQVSDLTINFKGLLENVLVLQSEVSARPSISLSQDSDDVKKYLNKQIPDQLLYVNRQESLQKFCKKIKNGSADMNSIDIILSNRDLLEHILVDSKHKALYCYVPKVACTNWKRVFMLMIGMVETSDILSIPSTLVHQQHFIPSLINFTKIEVQKMIETYTKFIFVRHPFERLLSAYKNKFEQSYNSSKYFQSRFGRKIIKTFRTNPSQRSLTNGDDVTFAEFVLYVTSKNSVFNEHWMPIDKLCEPCLVQYDFLGKYETLNADAQYLLEHLGVEDISFPQIKYTNTSVHLTKYISQLSYNSIINLYNIYHNDFKLFRYSLQGYLGYDLE